MKKGDVHAKEDADLFIQLIEDEWTDKIGSHSRETLAYRKYNKSQRFTFGRRCKKVTDYIEKEISRVNTILDNSKRFTRMATLTLAQIVLFNRKRAGEASRLIKVSYENAVKYQPPIDNEVKKSLSKF